MIKIDIISGFLGAGKTTLIKKLIAEGYEGQKLVLIENEFGEIGIDGGFLQDAGVTVNELNSGCICCSLTGDFRKALGMVAAQYAPDRIVIEPSGVGKLSEIVAAVQTAGEPGQFALGGLATVVDALRAKMYMKNFGEFFDDQVCSANCIVLSRTGSMSPEKLAEAEALMREKNPEAIIVSTDWAALTGRQLLDAIERKNTISDELQRLLDEHHEHEHHHHHDHEHHHEHEHDHDHDHEHEHEHDHEHHHHDHEHHHHEHDHHHHDADEVFQSWGAETSKKFTAPELEAILGSLDDEEKYGFVVRAKGYVASPDGGWVHFDYTPGQPDVRTGPANVAGRVCVIGADLKEDAVRALFDL